MVKRNIRLQPRDHAILDHVRRYRITTQEVLQMVFFPEQKIDAVKSTVRRLTGAGHLTDAPLYGTRKYYHLTTRTGRALFSLPDYFCRPLGEQALPQTFGVLCFCCLASEFRERFTREQFEAQFPDLASAQYPHPYYIDDDGEKKRLGCILVDQGADHKRILRKCRDIVNDKKLSAPFRGLIENDDFLIAIVTTRDTKKAAIEAAAERNAFRTRLRVETVPSLQHLI